MDDVDDAGTKSKKQISKELPGRTHSQNGRVRDRILVRVDGSRRRAPQEAIDAIRPVLVFDESVNHLSGVNPARRKALVSPVTIIILPAAAAPVPAIAVIVVAS